MQLSMVTMMRVAATGLLQTGLRAPPLCTAALAPLRATPVVASLLGPERGFSSRAWDALMPRSPFGRGADTFVDRALSRFGFDRDLMENLHSELFDTFDKLEKQMGLPSPLEWEEEEGQMMYTMRVGKGWSENDLQAEVSKDGKTLTVQGTRESDTMKQSVSTSVSLPFAVDGTGAIKLEYKADDGLLIARVPKQSDEAAEGEAKQVEEKAKAEESSQIEKKADTGLRVPIISSLPFRSGWQEVGDNYECTMRIGRGMETKDLKAEISAGGRVLTITGNRERDNVKQAVQSSITLPFPLADASALKLEYSAEQGALSMRIPKSATKKDERAVQVPIKAKAV